MAVPNWAALAVLSTGLVLSYYSFKSLNDQLIEATVVPVEDTDPKGKQLDPEAENKIPIDALHVLSQSHSFELRNAAIKVVASRAMTTDDPVRNRMLSDLASRDWQRRDNGINALWLLMFGLESSDNSVVTSHFTDHKTITSLVRGLINVLPDHKNDFQDPKPFSQGHPPSPVRPLQRPVHETSLIIPLREVLRSSKLIDSPNGSVMDVLSIALSAGLVSKWLTNYPFPCTLPLYSAHNYHKADITSLLSDETQYYTDDILLAELLKIILRSYQGRKELIAFGLLRPNTSAKFTENLDPTFLVFDDQHNGDVLMTNGSSTAGFPSETPWRTTTLGTESLPPIQWVDVSRRPRSTDRTQAEESRIRRHREAVVVAEGGGVLSSDNMFHRSFTGHEDPGPGLVEMVNAERRGSGGSAIDSPSEPSMDSMPDLDERVLHLQSLDLHGPHGDGRSL